MDFTNNNLNKTNYYVFKGKTDANGEINIFFDDLL